MSKTHPTADDAQSTTDIPQTIGGREYDDDMSGVDSDVLAEAHYYTDGDYVAAIKNPEWRDGWQVTAQIMGDTTDSILESHPVGHFDTRAEAFAAAADHFEDDESAGPLERIVGAIRRTLKR